MLLIPLHLENWSSVFCLYARQLIMRSSWPFFYKHSILVGKLINKSWLLDMFVRKNQSQKKTNEILRVSRSTAITVTMVFFGHEVCQAKADLEENLLNGSLQRRGWAMALKVWQLSVFFSDFVWFCLILFVQAANTLGRADLEFRSTRTSALSLIEKAMVAGDPKAHECHQYHFKAFPK